MYVHAVVLLVERREVSFSFEAGHSESHVNRQGRDRFACLGLERMGSVGHSSLFSLSRLRGCVCGLVPLNLFLSFEWTGNGNG